MILKICGTLSGWPKNTEKQGFFCGCLVAFFGLLSLWSPLGHRSSSYTLFTAKVSLILVPWFFLRWLCFNVCFSMFVFNVFLAFDFVVSLSCILAWSERRKTRWNHRISEILIFMFWVRACILTLSLGPANKPFLAQRRTPQNGFC